MPLRGYELVLVILVLILLFGAKRLPDTAKSLGQSLKIFKKSVRDEDGDQTKQQAAEKTSPREITASSEVIEPTRVDEPNRAER
jgi:sec-independent protein translocase protein TatA